MSGDRLVQLQVQRGAFVSVEAPAVESQSVLRHLINTIALAPWLCEPRVVAVGFTRADVVAASNVVFCTDVAAAVTETQRLVRESPQCTIVVVLGDENHDASVLEALGTRGVTVITTSTAMTLPPAKSASPSRVRIQRESMCWRIDTTGEMFRPYGVSAQEADDLRTMVGDLTTLTTTPDRNQAHHTAAPGALLRVLGPVELTLLTGREVSFRKSKSLELVAWLQPFTMCSVKPAAALPMSGSLTLCSDRRNSDSNLSLISSLMPICWVMHWQKSMKWRHTPPSNTSLINDMRRHWRVSSPNCARCAHCHFLMLSMCGLMPRALRQTWCGW
jgi:hypothetical protein